MKKHIKSVISTFLIVALFNLSMLPSHANEMLQENFDIDTFVQYSVNTYGISFEQADILKYKSENDIVLDVNSPDKLVKVDLTYLSEF